MRFLGGRLKKLLGAIFAILVLCAFSFSSSAAQITIGLTAQVDSVSDQYNLLENKIHQGDIITGFYIYDSLTPNSATEPTYEGGYQYTTPPYGMSLTVGGVTFQTNSANVDFRISLSNNYYGESHDYYGITSVNNLELDNGLSVDQLHWQLDDYSGTAISGTELPLGPLDLTKWQTNSLTITGGLYPFPPNGDKTLFQIRGHVTSAYLIPEPVSLSLFAFGGLLLRRKLK
jgi:hypothetical protein